MLKKVHFNLILSNLLFVIFILLNSKTLLNYSDFKFELDYLYLIIK